MNVSLPANFAFTDFCIPGLREITATIPPSGRWESYIAAASRSPAFAPAERSDIKGLDPLLAELDDVIDDLKNFRTSRRLEPPVELPVGLLHAGDPGTGKTLGARYIATASRAVLVDVTRFPHLSPEGPTRLDIRAMFEGAELYARSQEAPVLLFWDDIDKFTTGGSPHKSETIQELTTQLSGLYGARKGVLMIATTNQPDKIPRDLKNRRLKELKFGAPDRHGITALLQAYVDRFPHEDGIDYRSLTYIIYERAVPAKIEAMVQEAWRRAARIARRDGGTPRLTKQILTDVLLHEFLGQPDGRRFTPEEERQIALHEICHAVVGKTLGQKVPVVSMRSSLEQLGHAILSGRGNLITETDLQAWIASFQAGYAAKKLFGVPLMGYGSDLSMATYYATRLVEWWGDPKVFEGFSVHGLTWARGATQGPTSRRVSESLLRESEAAASKICRNQLARAERILRKFGARRLTWLADRLREQQVLLEADLDRLIAEAEKRSFRNPFKNPRS